MAIRVGLVGISGYGKTHLTQLQALQSAGLAEIAAAVVINPEQVVEDLATLQAQGTRIYPSLEAMLSAEKGRLQLVCIPTGIAFHEPMTVAALQNGCNVLVEKPAAGSVAAIDRMIAAEKAGKNFVAVGFQHIYAREIRFIKEYLVSGRLGAVKSITVMGLWPRNDSYYQRNNWAAKLRAADGSPIYDSPANNAFAHHLNIELFLAGRTFGEMAHATGVSGGLYRARPEIETFDSCVLRFSTDTGVQLTELLTHTSEANINPQFRVECEKGFVEWKQDYEWRIVLEDRTQHSGVVVFPHPDMFRDMVRLVNGGNAFRCSLSMAREHAHCIEMLHRDLSVVTPQNVSRRAEDGQYFIDGIAEKFTRAFRSGDLPTL